MQNHEALQKACEESLSRMHDMGVGNSKVTEIVACALVNFIADQAGAFTPAAVDQVCSIMQERAEELMSA
jgi:hypothetical protein